MQGHHVMNKQLSLPTVMEYALRGTPCTTSLPDGLEGCRVRYGFNKQQFAAVLGMPGPHYSEIIKPGSTSRNMTLNQARRAYAIGVPAEVLLQGPNT
jgi:hypothetical protein